MIIDEIRSELFNLQDAKYRNLIIKLSPSINPDTAIGVRTPQLKMLAKKYIKNDDIGLFLSDLPHKYFDENQLHAFIISEIKDFERCVDVVCRFLPFIDNWATCDQLSPKIFKKYKKELLEYINRWTKSDKTYTVRFGIGMLLSHFLDDDFDTSYLDTVASIKSDEYYINMMVAWFFATALAKQYKSTLPYIENRKLDIWTHNKTIQKAIESRRINDNQKAYLKSLKEKSVCHKKDTV